MRDLFHDSKPVTKQDTVPYQKSVLVRGSKYPELPVRAFSIMFPTDILVPT